MTSNNSFSANMLRLQKDFAARRLWVILFVTLPLLFAYPVMAGLQLSSVKSYAVYDTLSARGLTGTAIRQISNEGIPVVLFSAAAVFLAIQGFAYLFHKDRTDFYESLPFPRKSRFVLIYTNGLAIFFLAWLVSLLLTVLVCVAYSVNMGALLPVACVSFVRYALFFAAVYGVCVAAVMLAGSVLYAIMLTGFLFLAPAVFVAMAISYAETFYRTRAGGLHFRLFLNPFYNLLAKTGISGYRWEYAYQYGERTDTWSAALFSQQMKDALPYLLMLVVCFVLATVAAYLLYQKRRAEWAGTTICHYPVHVCVKLVTAIGAAIMIALAIQSMFFYGETSRHITALRMIVSLLCVAVIVALFMEGMYRRSVRGAFRTLWHLPVVCAASVLFFLAFHFDVFGHDRFLPDKAGATSFAISLDSIGNDWQPYQYVTNDPLAPLVDRQTHIRENMYLTDVEAMSLLMERSNALLRQADYLEETCVSGTVWFRLQNGREVARRICIPVKTDDELLSRVFDTEEYLHCVYGVFHDDALIQNMTANVSLVFTSDAENCSTDAKGIYENSTFYEAFSEAYRKDLENYTVITEREEAAIGTVSVASLDYGHHVTTYDIDTGRTSTGSVWTYNFPVYGTYENTIAFLKKADLYHEERKPYEGAFGEQEVKLKARVWTYDQVAVSVNAAKAVAVTEEQGEFMDFDGQQAEEIIENSVSNSLLSGWFDYDALDMRYGIQINTSVRVDEISYEMFADPGYSFGEGRTFWKGQVPAFLNF